MCVCVCVEKKVELATVVKGDPKAPFSIATTLRCRGGCNFIYIYIYIYIYHNKKK